MILISRISLKYTDYENNISWWKGQIELKKIVSWPYLMEKEIREAKILELGTNVRNGTWADF